MCWGSYIMWVWLVIHCIQYKQKVVVVVFSACLGSRTWGQKSHFPFLLEPGRRCFLCPWDKIKKEEELVELGDGSWIDPSTCPPGMSTPVTHQGKQAPWHGEIFMHRSSYIKCIWMAYHKPMCNSPLECQQEKICCMHVKSVYLLWLLQMIWTHLQQFPLSLLLLLLYLCLHPSQLKCLLWLTHLCHALLIRWDHLQAIWDYPHQWVSNLPYQ